MENRKSMDKPAILLAEAVVQLNEMHFSGRMAALVEMGRSSRESPILRSCITQWSNSSLYERLLALQTSFGSRDATIPLRALADPTLHMKRRAVKAVSVLCSHNQLVAASEALPASIKKSLVSKLRQRRRLDVIEAILDRMAQKDRSGFIDCLPYGPKTYVAIRINDVVAHMSNAHWARMAKIHPQLTHRALLDRINHAHAKDYTLLLTVNKVVPILTYAQALTSPVPIIKAMLSTFQISSLAPSILPLVNRYPSDMLEVALELEERVPARWSKVVNDVPLDDLIELNRRNPGVIDSFNFELLDPKRRAQAFEAFQQLWRSSHGLVDIRIVKALPTAQRVAEARRHLHLTHVESHEMLRMSYAGLLPWKESLAIILDYTKSKDVDIRAAAIEHQISSARFSRKWLGEALQLAIQRRHENDIVRRSMLKALSELPMSIWGSEHLESLHTVIADTLAAADLSWETAHYLNELILRLFSKQPNFAVTMATLFVQKRDNALQSPNADYGRLASRTVCLELERALLPFAHQWMERREYEKVTSLAQLLDKSFTVSSAFWQIIEKLALESNDGWYAQAAINLMSTSKTGRKVFLQLVPRLLDADPSWVETSTIRSTLQMRMQRLLTPFLTPRGLRGKFNPDGQVRVTLFNEYPHTWTQQQQKTYADALISFIQDATQSEHRQVSYVDALAKLHYVPEGPEAVAAFAQDAQRPVIRDKAVRALAQLDEGRGIPQLLEALGDDRARIAIYAVGRVLKSMGPHEALAILKSVRTQKVTVLKEIMRLVGDLETDDALAYLLQKERDPDVHVDTRLAILGRLWGYASWDGVRPVLELAAKDKNKEVAKLVVELPAQGKTDELKAFLLELLATTLSHPHPEVRLAALRRAASMPLPDPTSQLAPHLVRIITTSGRDAEVQSAATALFQHYAAAEPSKIAWVFASLIDSVITQQLPDRRKLLSVFNIFLATAHLPASSNAASAVQQALSVDPLCSTLRLRLLIKSRSGAELNATVVELAPHLHSDALAAAETEIEMLYARKGPWLQALEQELRLSGSEQSRRLGLAALKGLARGPDGWTDVRRRALDVYRRDAHQLVAEAAAFCFPPEPEQVDED